jgi:hypothetical protein
MPTQIAAGGQTVLPNIDGKQSKADKADYKDSHKPVQ